MASFAPHPPRAIKGIPKWVFAILPKKIAFRLKKTGILEPEDVQVINLTKILPFSLFLTIGFPLFLLLVFWAATLFSKVTLGITIVIAIILGLITLSPLFNRKRTDIEIKWYGLLMIGGQPINILLPPGSYIFWLPEKILSIPLVQIKLIPEREITLDLNGKEGGVYSSDGIELKTELTYVLRIGCVSSSVGYILEQEKQTPVTARASLEEIKNQIDDFLFQVMFKSTEQNTYEEMVITGTTSGELNSMFWKQLTTSREIWYISKYEGSRPFLLKDNVGNILKTIHPGKVLITQGGAVSVNRIGNKKKITLSKRRPVFLSEEDYQFWQQSLDENGEQVFFPEYGALLLKAWVKRVQALNPIIHEAFLSRIVQERIGKGAIETAKATQEAYNQLVNGLKAAHPNLSDQEAHDNALVLLGKKTISEEIKSFGLSKETMDGLAKMAEIFSTIPKKH